MNNKQRKLEYIRFKNGLRSGKNRFFMYQKCSNDILEEMVEEIKEDLIKQSEKKSRKYKTDLPYFKIELGTDHFDFLRNTSTIGITRSIKPLN